MSKATGPADRVYRIMVQLDDGTNPCDIQNLDRAALARALKYGYLIPSRFIPASHPIKRPQITAYKITQEGREFLHRCEA